MKLRNKQTPSKLGKIVPYDNEGNVGIAVKTDQGIVWYYHSLAELNEEWEDYEEPKGIWWLDNEGNVNHTTSEVGDNFAKNREIGNYFSSKEEAERAVEKLKAWKWLKDNCNFRFNGIVRGKRGKLIGVKVEYDEVQVTFDTTKKGSEILDLLFGGEE